VVERARDGLAVHFPLADERRLTVPASKTKLVAIHRSADLATIDVTAMAAELDRYKIAPVTLSRKGHRPVVGEHVFAIGHPSGGKLELTSTLSDGIVSGVGRKEDEARYLQVTVPLNPGNSGGPLFDDDGLVVGVNTFIIRKNPGRETILEALNFSLEGEFIHEIINEPSKSLTHAEIQDILNPPALTLTDALARKMKDRVQPFLTNGYSYFGETLEFSTDVWKLQPREQRSRLILFSAGKQYAVAVMGQDVDDVDLAVLRPDGRPIAVDNRTTPHPDLRFRPDQDGFYAIAVRNPTNSPAVIVVTALRKQ
jgi:S1-C subfamily serine protease